MSQAVSAAAVNFPPAPTTSPSYQPTPNQPTSPLTLASASEGAQTPPAAAAANIHTEDPAATAAGRPRCRRPPCCPRRPPPARPPSRAFGSGGGGDSCWCAHARRRPRRLTRSAPAASRRDALVARSLMPHSLVLHSLLKLLLKLTMQPVIDRCRCRCCRRSVGRSRRRRHPPAPRRTAGRHPRRHSSGSPATRG